MTETQASPSKNRRDSTAKLAKLIGFQKYSRGLVLVFAVATSARLLSGIAGFVPEAVLALLIGTLVNNARPLSPSCRPGIGFVHRYLLRVAIVLLGTTITFAALLRITGTTILLVSVCVVLSFSLCTALGRFARLQARISTLLGAGTAICGASAILTVGPIIGAVEGEVAYAVGTIFTFNALAVVLYPYVGHALALSDLHFGTWAGTAINDTSAVVATGYMYSDAAGAAATVVKLTRTVLLVPLAVLIGIVYESRQGGSTRPTTVLRRSTPWFVFGFIGSALLNTLGALPTTAVSFMGESAKFLIVAVLASVGLGMSLAQIRQMGCRPLLIGLVVGAAISVISLALMAIFGI